MRRSTFHRRPAHLVLLVLFLALAAGIPHADGAAPRLKTRNVVLVLIDGLRWQEVFTGAEERLIAKEGGGVADPEALRKEFWRPTPEARREMLMPFLWGTVARQGQLFGNREKGSRARVANTFHFSYPGYSEMIVGYPDPRINSNNKKPNPNVSVFEWLHGKPGFRDRVAAFGAWDVVPWIVNRERCGFFVNAAYEPVRHGKISPRQELLNQLKATMTQPWDWGPYDGILIHSALEYLKANRTRAMWLAFGEPDEWAHERRYDRYLQSIRNVDGYLRTLWETLQGMPEYRDRTTLLVSVDHGRGRTPADWTSHGTQYPGADEIWMAGIGPDTPALGERRNVPEVTQGQLAASVAALLGEDYNAAQPKAAPPITDLLPR